MLTCEGYNCSSLVYGGKLHGHVCLPVKIVTVEAWSMEESYMDTYAYL